MLGYEEMTPADIENTPFVIGLIVEGCKYVANELSKLIDE